MRQSLLMLVLVALSSCAPKSSNQSAKLINASVINGSKVNEKDLLNSSVVAVYNIKSKYICTGTLIAPNIVMTAAHCAPKKTSELKIIFATDVDSVLNSRKLDVVEEYALSVTDFKVHPQWNEFNETKEFNVFDIAILKFKGALPLGYKPATFLKDESEIRLGTIVTVAGFGVDFVDTNGIEPKKHPRLEQEIINGKVYCEDDLSGKHVKCYKIDMSGDGVLRTTEAPISFIYDSEVQLSEKKAGTCSGDSGGPAYIKKDGEYFLFGVTSRGSELCDEVGIYTNALKFQKWLEETIPTLK